MKHIRFYLEYPSKKEKRKATRKNLGDHSGTVLAVFYEDYRIHESHINYDCAGSLFNIPNSDCCGSVCDSGFLSDNCKRISEQQAKEIHPKLFIYLDY